MSRLVAGAAALLLASCITVEDAEPNPGTVLRECGPRPLAPGRGVAFQTVNGTTVALMSPADYAALEAYLDEVADWQACATEH